MMHSCGDMAIACPLVMMVAVDDAGNVVCVVTDVVVVVELVVVPVNVEIVVVVGLAMLADVVVVVKCV